MKDSTSTAVDGLQELDAEALAERQARAQQMLVDDMHRVLSSKSGRRFVWHLLESAGVYRQSFTTDPLVTAFNEGNRRYGLEVLDLITRHAPEKFLLMQSEHHARSD